MNLDKEQTVPQHAILVNPEDIHCIIFHVVCLVAYGLAFWLYLHPEIARITDIGSRLAFVGASALMLGWISGVNIGVNFHNHVHRKIFRLPWLNLWITRLWAFSGGWPGFFWEYHHLIIHHPRVMNSEDWTAPRYRSDGCFENIYRFCFAHWPCRYIVHLWQEFRAGGKGEYTRHRAVKELVIFLCLWSIPFWIDPLMALGLWALPHYIANVVIIGTGMYVQHVGCMKPSSEHPYRHSVTFISPFFNLTMFNIGYHIEHHAVPSIHWSQLPAFHERLKPDLIRDKAHIVPSGYYYWGIRLLFEPERTALSKGKFALTQHPDYLATSSISPTHPIA
jgi:fatty acid desaturase